MFVCVHVCVRACVPACVPACVRACVRAWQSGGLGQEWMCGMWGRSKEVIMKYGVVRCACVVCGGGAKR